MDTRRDFIKKAALLSGAAGIWSALPASIQRAMAINPAPGSTYLDAEHIVILMQENRSFDHCYGTLKGVRGYNDPRAIQLPDQHPVWLQTNAAGETYAPFRLNLKDTKATWMSSLPHSWENQVDARNDGKYDRWLHVKESGNKDYAPMPLTLGYYTREDIPFYYAFADAFTVCDQNFCSSLTGTTPNRLYLWTGTIRDEQQGNARANVRNEDVDYGKTKTWTTFPERLEENGISWKIYQNEISVGVGFDDDEDAWLANFTDNPIEWFAQYNVHLHPAHMQYLQQQLRALPAEIAALEKETGEAVAKKLKRKRELLEKIKTASEKYHPANFDKLSAREKNLHRKAFTTNVNDPDYHQLTDLQYKDGDTERTMKAPKGDVLHQFRTDVKKGELPVVSWLVAPQHFSDHPSSPWFGAWYVSEVLDILTQRPEVWKKTIFILCYDENDGYYDHVPPFTAPHRPGTGKVSAGIDTSLEYVTKEQELRSKGVAADEARESPIGLGFRVPLVIASPWSRGGYVNSQVFDHTSILQLMEEVLSHKTGKPLKETNISAWRRAVCGNLSSTFRPYQGEQVNVPFPERDIFLEEINNARYKKVPDGFKRLTAADIAAIRQNPASSLLPQQERGIRPSCALPYELYADGAMDADRKHFRVRFHAGNKIFGKAAAGAPFNVYAPGRCRQEGGEMGAVRTWSYAVTAGDQLDDTWTLSDFEQEQYHLRVYGPNGFYREFSGSAEDPQIQVRCTYGTVTKGGGQMIMVMENRERHAIKVLVKDNAYGGGEHRREIAAGAKLEIPVHTSASHGWYDVSVAVPGHGRYGQRFAGRVETGRDSFSDPLMGRIQ